MNAIEKTARAPIAENTRSTLVSSTPSGGSRFAETLRSVQHRGRDLDGIFAKAAQKHNVPQELLRAISFHESGFQTDAVSHAGAMGLMQLMPATAQTMGVTDPFDPEQNVMGGAKLLGQYLEKYDGDLKLTLAAYGAGSGAVAKYGGVPPYKETQRFVEDIMSVVHAGGLSAWDSGGAPVAFSAAVTRIAPESGSTLPVTYAPPTTRTSIATAEQNVFSLYPALFDEIDTFDSFTEEDYRVFIASLLREMQASALQKQKDDTKAVPLFFLG